MAFAMHISFKKVNWRHYVLPLCLDLKPFGICSSVFKLQKKNTLVTLTGVMEILNQ